MKEEFDRSTVKPARDKTFADFYTESGCDKLNAATTSSDTVAAVNKFILLTAKLNGIALIGLQEDLRERLNNNKIPGVSKILNELFKVEKKFSKKADEIPPKYRPLAPWPAPVNGAAVLSEITKQIERFIILPEGVLADTIALYIMSSYFMEVYDLFPLLHITSPVKGCGKSKLTEVIEVFLPFGHIVTDPSSAALFRTVDKYKVSIIVDEVQDVFKKHEDVQAFCVASYRRKNAEGFMRCTKEGKVESYSAWGAKVLAGIGELKLPALNDRVIRISLEKRTHDEKIERLRTRSLEKIGLPIRRQLARFADDNMEKIEKVMETGPIMPVEFEGHDRPADNFESLIAVGNLCGEGWDEKARDAAVASLGEKAEDDSSYAEDLLKDFRDLFKEHPKAIHNKVLLPALNANEERPWGGWNNGTGIITRDINKQFKRFKIRADNVPVDGVRAKGFKEEWFTKVFERYLPPLPLEDGTAVREGTPPYGNEKEEPYQESSKENNGIEGDGTGNDQNQGIPIDEGRKAGSLPDTLPPFDNPPTQIDTTPIKYTEEEI